MNVAFMGTPAFACASLQTLADSKHKILAVVTGPDKPSGRGRKLTAGPVKKLAISLGLNLFQPDNLRDSAFREEMAGINADVYVVIAFKILPPKLFKLPRQGSLNIHASLLPKYRGAAPINHALLNGEKETGLTSFFLSKKVDGGEIIHQVSTAIDENENFSSLYNRLSTLAGPFLLETLDLISDPGFSPQKQDISRATPAPKISPKDALIDWNMSRKQVHNHIRAYSTKPGAFSYLDNKKIKILGSRLDDPDRQKTAEPGNIFVDGRRLFAATGDTPLCITTLQPEGKKEIDSNAFKNGYLTGNTQTFKPSREEVIK